MLLLALHLTFAQATDVRWETVTDVALDAWSRGPGVEAEATAEGADRAARATFPVPGLSAESRVGAKGQQEAAAVLSWPVGIGARERSAWRATAEATRAAGEADRAAYVATVHDAFLDWWMAHEIGEHLQAWSAEVEAGLVPVDAAVADGLIAALEAEDLRAELATVRAEAAAAAALEARAEARLAALLGQPVELDAGGHHVHDLDLDSLPNPWLDLVEQADAAPAVRSHQAAALQATAQARHVSTWLPSLTLGSGVIETGSGLGAFVVIGMDLPLRAPGAAAARQARGRASAARARADWTARVIAGELAAEATAFEADREHARRLRSQVSVPLAGRLDRLEVAFAEGLVSADRVIRARRDHHEADHAELEVAASLLASEARARATRLLLDGTVP